jgi:hypothetical protein
LRPTVKPSVMFLSLLCQGLITASLLVLPAVGHAQAATAGQLPVALRQKLEAGQQALQASLQALGEHPAELVADAAVFAKGIEWALRYDTEFSPADIALLENALARGQERVAAIAGGKPGWIGRPGKVAVADI